MIMMMMFISHHYMMLFLCSYDRAGPNATIEHVMSENPIDNDNWLNLFHSFAAIQLVMKIESYITRRQNKQVPEQSGMPRNEVSSLVLLVPAHYVVLALFSACTRTHGENGN